MYDYPAFVSICAVLPPTGCLSAWCCAAPSTCALLGSRGARMREYQQRHTTSRNCGFSRLFTQRLVEAWAVLRRPLGACAPPHQQDGKSMTAPMLPNILGRAPVVEDRSQFHDLSLECAIEMCVRIVQDQIMEPSSIGIFPAFSLLRIKQVDAYVTARVYISSATKDEHVAIFGAITRYRSTRVPTAGPTASVTSSRLRRGYLIVIKAEYSFF